MTTRIMEQPAGAHATEAGRPLGKTRMRDSVPGRNNLDLIRLVLASIVLVVHGAALPRAPELQGLLLWFDSRLAVEGFFIVSGFLIFRSYEQSSTFSSYIEKRFRRIYPAYLTVVLVSVVAGIFLTESSLSDYFSMDLVRYLVSNLTFMNFVEPSLPGVFTKNPINSDVNGALWTIKIEVMFYLSVPLLVAAIRRFGALATLITIYILSYIYLYAMVDLHANSGRELYLTLGKQLPGQMMFFAVGGLSYYYFGFLKRNLHLVALLGIILFALGRYGGIEFVTPIGFAGIILWAAFGPYLFNAGKYGDFSYGIYIWHYPITQVLFVLGMFAWQPELGFLTVFVLSGLAAFVSWHLIERPSLKSSSHYVVAAVDQPDRKTSAGSASQ